MARDTTSGSSHYYKNIPTAIFMWDKILRILKGDDNQEGIPEGNPTGSVTDNAIDMRKRIIDTIVGRLRSMALSHDKACLTIWVDDVITERILEDPSFMPDLRTSLDNALLDSLGGGKIDIKPQAPPEESRAIEISPQKVYITLGAAIAPKKPPTPKIMVKPIEGTGSTSEAEYILDSRKKQVFHIGRGLTVRKPGQMRQNDIIINVNDPDMEIQDRNNHVSSSQADIIYKNGNFYIKAMPSGCRAIGGSPTKIIRNETASELRDINTLFPLCDGDIIELGRSVMLSVSTIG